VRAARAVALALFALAVFAFVAYVATIDDDTPTHTVPGDTPTLPTTLVVP
jgi:hypothetical protein